MNNPDAIGPMGSSLRITLFALFLLSFTPLALTQPPVSLRTQLLFGQSAAVPTFRDTSGRLFMPDSVMTGSRSTKSPVLAIILSAVAPGTGQIYAQRYWTIPLIWGFGYWFARQYSIGDRKYEEWKTKYSESLKLGGFGQQGDLQAKSIRDFYRDERDRFAFYLGLTYVLNILDAYIGASLYNFDVSDDLGGSETVGVQLRIPLK